MTSSPRQAYEAHVAALATADLDAVVTGYAEDAVVVGNGRIGSGREFVRALFTEALQAAADLRPDTQVLVDGDVVFVSWTADAPAGPLTGADTFVVRDGLITVHTGFVASGRPAAGLPGD